MCLDLLEQADAIARRLGMAGLQRDIVLLRAPAASGAAT